MGAFALSPPNGPCAGSFLSWHFFFCEPYYKWKGTFPSATPCISKNLGHRKLERKVKECDLFPCLKLSPQVAFLGHVPISVSASAVKLTQFYLDLWLMDTVFLLRTRRATWPRIWPGDWHFIWRIKEGIKWINDKLSQFSNLVSIFCITFVLVLTQVQYLAGIGNKVPFLLQKSWKCHVE